YVYHNRAVLASNERFTWEMRVNISLLPNNKLYCIHNSVIVYFMPDGALGEVTVRDGDFCRAT
ncbi:MAG: hypothetical protein O2985_10970, partial [Proteobacteria bacterium]|nr:hypothetical protein [Pseudomonadota bacterium]